MFLFSLVYGEAKKYTSLATSISIAFKWSSSSNFSGIIGVIFFGISYPYLFKSTVKVFHVTALNGMVQRGET